MRPNRGRRALLATCALSASVLAGCAHAAPDASPGAPEAVLATSASAVIHVNQIGFATSARKVGVVVSDTAATFVVLTMRGDTAFAGTLDAPRAWPPSGERVRQADFTRLARAGRYVLAVPGLGRSTPFAIEDAPYRSLALAAVKAFYYQRVSTPLGAEYAGAWTRAAGHADDSVVVHPSAASAARPAGTVIAAPRGWYDAGDYNLYVVNSGISTYTLLAVAEELPDYAASLRTGIPESANALPDVLDEALWNLGWMRAMQDPSDGGVYHKLTNAAFDGFVMPDRARTTRYVVQKGTAATLDFAAVAAQASRVVRRYPRALPGLADSLVREALRAWGWARAHPDSTYDQARLNARYAPAISTGGYGDGSLDDERRWAAAELYLATRADSFLVAAEPLAGPMPNVPSWASVRTLGLYSLVEHRRELPPGFDTTALVRRLSALGDTLVARTGRSAYGVPMESRDFVWGSNATAANQGMALIHAWRATGDPAALGAARDVLDYLLGRNATGYAFVTGFGARPPRAPHHRPSQADGIDAPVPGFLVGGPNPGQQDHCPGYPSRLPALSYLDDVCAYAANEVAINWNAPLAYLAAALDAIDAGATSRRGLPSPGREAAAETVETTDPVKRSIHHATRSAFSALSAVSRPTARREKWSRAHRP